MKTLLLAGALAAPFASFAQGSMELPPITVTATRSEQSELRLPASVRTISRAEIEASGAAHVVEVLRATGTMQVTDFFGDGSRTQVDVRGFGDAANATTLILVDGRRLNNPDIATPDLNSIALKDVERIEIIEGSAGALYGDQAVGGVINIITRKAADPGFDLEARSGSYDALAGRSSARLGFDDTELRFSAEDRRSRNYRDHNRLDYDNLFGRGQRDWRSGQVFVEGARIEEQLQTPGALFAGELARDRRQSSATFAGDFSNTQTRLLRVGLRQALGAHWQLEAEGTQRSSAGVFRLSFAGFPSAQDSTQDRKVRSFNPRLSGSLPMLGRTAQLTLGADLQHARYRLSSPFGVQTNDQRMQDVYAQATLPLPGAVDLTLGARQARIENQVLDGFTFTVPTRFGDAETAAQAGLAWQPLPALRLFARYDSNFRYAKIDEFTSAGAPPGTATNPLRTQTGKSYETGADVSAGPLRLRATLYRLETENEIAFNPLSFANENLAQTQRDGALLDLRWQALRVLALAAGAHYVDAQVTQGALAGKDVPMVAQRTGSLAATVQWPARGSLRAEALYTGSRAFAGDFDNTLARLPSHTVVNLAAAWPVGPVELAARVNNLLDREYSEYGASAFDAGEVASFLPSPERNFSLSLRYDY
ncbi:MAG TPA: TonB-dependent receptor [Solimonas sp.]|nr:TonB-dependent receptor [Solimonas sp.]